MQAYPNVSMLLSYSSDKLTAVIFGFSEDHYTLGIRIGGSQ